MNLNEISVSLFRTILLKYNLSTELNLWHMYARSMLKQDRTVHLTVDRKPFFCFVKLLICIICKPAKCTSSHLFSPLRTYITLSTSVFTVTCHGSLTVGTRENSTLHPRTILLAFWTKSAAIFIKLWPCIITSGLIAFKWLAFRWASFARSASAIFRI